jgi:hypothetical protein
MRTVDELLARSKRWLAENADGANAKQAWDAVHAVLEEAGPNELADAVSELVEAAEGDDKDAQNVLAAFRRFHPPGALGNPVRQEQLVGLYLVFSRGGLWDASSDVDTPQFRRAVRRMFE